MAIDFNDSNIQELERIVKQAFKLACDGNDDALEVLKPLNRKEIMWIQHLVFASICMDLQEAKKRKPYYDLE